MFAHFFKPLSDKEELQLKLDIVHLNTKQEEEKYLASIRANVKSRWPITVVMLEEMRLMNNKGQEVIYG